MNSPDPMLLKAISTHKAGRTAEAKVMYERILRRRPDDPDALNFLGVLEAQQGNGERGIKLLRRSLQLGPENPHAWVNLGNMLAQALQIDDACTAYERATALAPENWEPWYNLGVLNRHRGRTEDALECLKKALVANPDHNLAYERLGNLLTRADRHDEAAQLYKDWFEYNPKSALARHMYAATSGQSVPTRAADDYVVELFDGFAESFDSVLENLGYRAPALVAATVEKRVGSDGGGPALRILDAGCGTGLCGPLLRPLAAHLCGVDLSSGMVGKARTRKVYDELVVRELCEFMQSRPDAFDAIVSADTLVYFGDLAEVIAAAHRCLRPGGLLTFTVERWETEDASASYRIEHHGRYCHAESYVCRVLAAAGFDAPRITREVLRKELGADVSGIVVSARRTIAVV